MLTNISINSILNLTSILFFIGLLGVVLNRKNILTILMSIEILLLAVNLNFAALSIYLDDIVGHIFVIFILTIAAAESAIGLAIITRFYNLKNSIEILLLAVNLNFAALSIYLDDIVGHIFVIFILTIAAAESAIGLAIITRFYNLKNSIELEPVKKKLTNKL